MAAPHGGMMVRAPTLLTTSDDIVGQADQEIGILEKLHYVRGVLAPQRKSTSYQQLPKSWGSTNRGPSHIRMCPTRLFSVHQVTLTLYFDF